MEKIIKNAIPAVLGLLMIIFGLNKFIGFIPVEPPADATAQMFMGAMFTSYLFAIVAIFEIVGGILLFSSKTRFLAWLLLLPVVFNIVAFHIAYDFIGNGIWLLPTALFMIVGYFNRNKLVQIIG
ncbi:MAG: hypothetical protein RLO81_00355 [Fulvivirga sp.]|uniref:DoxX family membrane protein n=1 Tax=Fulvivirga sp. TaxID=1931237 RepID=UPI0032EB48BC